ncbi:MAG: phosphopantetheine-binding protein [Symbiobacterium sp.]|uniref:phosphopantetheine-binding protein n=1 Tax=Symbiobacterium sp. TaxID=1971213 RepID=UPI003464E434
MSESLQYRIKKLIIDRLNLDVRPEDIDDDAPIFRAPPEDGEVAATAEPGAPKGLELDSIDALELVVALNNEFGVQIGDDDMMIFQSINTLAAYIAEHSPAAD